MLPYVGVFNADQEEPQMNPLRLLDHAPPPERVVARLGLIADTHYSDRLAALPDTLSGAFAGVDLILHAGDVGTLDVLDALGAIAPVVAVHGNDDTPEAQRELPYQQLLVVGGLRLLLTHAHYPDRAEELAARREDRWAPKLERRAAMGRRAGSPIVVFGHTHVPMAVPWGETLLVNPGAIAPGNHFVRQTLRSVARLLVSEDGGVAVEHLDLDAGGQSFTPSRDLDAGFAASIAPLSVPIVDAELHERLPQVRALFAPGGLKADEAELVRAILRRLAFPRWDGVAGPLTRTELLDAFRAELPAPLAARATSALQ
jgi:putative phosphoesterase